MSPEPSFVTTPGSDFSLLCSLIFELACGRKDEGLAGAINRFSRSERRAKFDNDLAQSQAENSDEAMRKYEADNFNGWRHRLEGIGTELEFWKSALASDRWDEFQRQAVSLRIADIRQRLDALKKVHGPFLVWAHHESKRQQEIHWKSFIESEKKALSLKIELGKTRRQHAPSTSNSTESKNASTPKSAR